MNSTEHTITLPAD